MPRRKSLPPTEAPQEVAPTAPDPAPVDAETPPESEQDYNRFLPAALAMSSEHVKPYTADMKLIQHNTQTGVESVSPYLARLKNEAAGIDQTHITELPSLVQGLDFAVGVVERYASPPTGTAAEIKEMTGLRTLLLTVADGLVLAGIFPANKVQPMHRSIGPTKFAGDCVSLASLFSSKKFAQQIEGKSAVTPEKLQRAAKLGAKLKTKVRPKNAKKQRVSPELAQARDRRDRLWTLTEDYQEDVWKAGAYLFGRSLVEEKVPPLTAHVIQKPKPQQPPLPPSEDQNPPATAADGKAAGAAKPKARKKS